MKPKPQRIPITEGTIGVGDTGRIRATTEIYLPSAFGRMRCIVENLQIELLALNKLAVRGNFHLEGSAKTLQELYREEEWKAFSLFNFLEAENYSLSKDYKHVAPIFLFLFNPELKIDKFTLRIDNNEVPPLYDQTPDFIFLPNSFPPLVDNMPPKEKFVYFESKSTAIYASLRLGSQYRFEALIEVANPDYRFAVLFPYSEVQYKDFTYGSSAEFSFEAPPILLTPVREKTLPAFVEAKLTREINPQRPTPPIMRPANPFRKTQLKYCDRKIITEIDNFTVRDYSAIQFTSFLMIPENKDFEIMVTPTQSNIPIRVYELLQKLPNLRDFLVTFDIYNLNKDRVLDLEIVSEIKDYSHEEISNVIVYPILQRQKDGLRKRKARVVLHQAPRLKRGIPDKITKPEKATLFCRVRDKQLDRIIYQSSFDINFLPKDFIVWNIKDSKGEHKYRLSEFLGAWVFATDNEELLDKIRSEAAKYHPMGVLVGASTDNREEIRLQIKALYDYLSKESGIKYVNQPFYFGIKEEGQRILTPDTVIKLKAGNCIDLTVLFASLMEGLGINPLIMLMPSHAFLAWGNKHETRALDFLECTCLGRKSFEEAQKMGEENFKKNFLFIGAENPLPNDITFMSKGCEIIDLSEVRAHGIYSIF